MFALMGRPLLVLVAVAAALTLVAAVTLAVRRSDRSLRVRILARGAPVAVLVVAAQVLAVTAFALVVNDRYVFYTSWDDLTGQVGQGTSIQAGGLVGKGQGRLQVLTVHRKNVGSSDQVMVWLPPEYDQPAYSNHKFPVVEFLSGQPSSPETVFSQFHFGENASKAIASRKVPPFVAVFPTLMVAPPRDTECTNIPGGPRAESWLSTDVPGFVSAHFRVSPPGPQWSAMGWSTGGFCAAKLVAGHPAQFGSGVSFGGYYKPLQDGTTGKLFGGSKSLRKQNSPAWLYRSQGGLRGSRLLLVAGQQDHETWRATQEMLTVTAGDPAVSHIAFPQGGHNYRNYSAYLPAALEWSARAWAP